MEEKDKNMVSDIENDSVTLAGSGHNNNLLSTIFTIAIILVIAILLYLPYRHNVSIIDNLISEPNTVTKAVYVNNIGLRRIDKIIVHYDDNKKARFMCRMEINRHLSQKYYFAIEDSTGRSVTLNFSSDIDKAKIKKVSDKKYELTVPTSMLDGNRHIEGWEDAIESSN